MSLKERRRALIIFLVICLTIVAGIVILGNVFSNNALAATRQCETCKLGDTYRGTLTYYTDTNDKHFVICSYNHCELASGKYEGCTYTYTSMNATRCNAECKYCGNTTTSAHAFMQSSWEKLDSTYHFKTCTRCRNSKSRTLF